VKIKLLVLLFCLSSLSVFAQDKLEKRIQTLESKVAELEKLIKANPQSKPITSTSKAKSNEPSLVLSDWGYSYEKGRTGGSYNIKYSLINSYNKGIKLIDATIQFKDLLGERLYGIKVTPDLKLNSGQVIQDGGSYSVNRFMNEQMRMKNMAKEDVLATLKIRKIVFTDNTILEL